jgi:hypothetical protein
MIIRKRFFYAPDDGTGNGGDGNGGDGTGSTGDQGKPENDAEKRLAAMEATLTKMQSNFDRKNTEFQKLKEENEELKKAQMQEDERREYEKKQHEAELEKREKALALKEFELKKTQIMGDKGIPSELGNAISGSTIEEYQKNVDYVSETIEKEVKARVEKAINEKLGGAKQPGSGGGEVPKGKQALIQKYNEAEKAGNAPLMLALDEQIRNFKE